MLRAFLIIFCIASFVGIITITIKPYLGSHPTITNYRLTLEVEADGTIYKGSGVIETKWFRNPFEHIGNAWSVQIRGEAVVVDLGKHGILFALLSTPPQFDRTTGDRFYLFGPESVMRQYFSLQVPGNITQEQADTLVQKRSVVELPFSGLPELVRFKDINDPMSVELVEPDNLAARFGPGVKLLRATVQITDDPPTTGIEQRLPWLKGLQGAYLSRKPGSASAPLGLHGGYFKTGEE